MKQTIIAAAISVFTLTTAFAAKNDKTEVVKKTATYPIHFTRIEVSDDIDLELSESAGQQIEFTGKMKDVDNVVWKIKRGVLYLSSNNGSLKNRAKVSLAVKNLKEIIINGESTVKSVGYLNSPKLSILMDGDCKVSVKNAGQVIINRGQDTELNVIQQSGPVLVNQ